MFRLGDKYVSRIALVMVLVAFCPAAAQVKPGPGKELAIATTSLPDGLVGRQYRFVIQTEGGAYPLRWRVLDVRKLPPGLVLDQFSGALTGTPRSAGIFRFEIEVTDANLALVMREFTVRIRGLLEVRWKRLPVVEADQILGSVEVSNYSEDSFDLTVIVVAVNEVGKAFALGYEHIQLGANVERREVTFGERNNLPYGDYIIHVDAVAEVPAKNMIVRDRLQTPRPLTIARP